MNRHPPTPQNTTDGKQVTTHHLWTRMSTQLLKIGVSNVLSPCLFLKGAELERGETLHSFQHANLIRSAKLSRVSTLPSVVGIMP